MPFFTSLAPIVTEPPYRLSTEKDNLLMEYGDFNTT